MILEGYATYIFAAAGAIVTGLYILGIIDQKTWEMIMGLLVSGGAASLRRSVARVPDQVAIQAVAVAKKLAKDDDKERKNLKTDSEV